MAKLRDDPRTVKLISTGRGRLVFTLIAGGALLQAVTAVKFLGEVIDVWTAHTDATGAPLPPGEPTPALPSLQDLYDECWRCYLTVDRRAEVCPACRTERTPNPIVDDPSDGDHDHASMGYFSNGRGERTYDDGCTVAPAGELVVDEAELSRP
jgi:hypothetical protein